MKALEIGQSSGSALPCSATFQLYIQGSLSRS